MATTSKNGSADSKQIMSREDLDETTLNEIAQTCHVDTEDIEDVYACTPVQLGIMADSIKQPGMYMYRLTIAIAPHVDLDQFCAAIQAVVAREAILRTRIVDSSSGIVQVVLRETHVTVRAPPNITIGHYLQQEQAPVMGLAEPLLVTAIVDRRLVIATHHVMGDGWANTAMLEDVAQIYRGQSPSIRAPFKDFVRHHYNTIHSTIADQFWAARLKGYPIPFPQLPSESYLPHPTQKTTKTVSIGKTLSAAMIPLYIEAAWAITAWNYTGETAVGYGMVLSGRTPTGNGLETTLGPTVETFPVSVVLQPTGSIQDLLKARARDRRQVQSDSMRYGLNAIRSINDETRQACRFQTLLNILLRGRVGTGSNDLTLEAREGTIAPFALCLDIFLLDRGRLSIEASSDPKIIDDQQVQRILNQFEHNLENLTTASPESSLASLRWLNPHDYVEILGWNEHVGEYLEECLHDRFRARAKEFPSRSAVECYDGHATYAQLDRMTDRIALDLQHRGVEIGSPMVFMFEKSFWAVVAIVSILKAGGVCVPIDASLPQERKSAILALSEARLTLTSTVLYQDTSLLGKTEVLVLDDLYVAGLSESETVPTKILVAPRNLAYIQFTSGSTGVPKGVQIEHGNIVSGMSPHAQLMGWKGEFRVLQCAAYAWDASILEIWCALMFGGTICIPSEDARLSNLAGFIAANNVHWAVLTPTVIGTLSPSDVPSLRTLACGGEPIDPKLATTWGASTCLIHVWCPCESGWNMTVARLTPQARYADTIGKPVHCALWLTRPDNCNELAPIGSVGEMIVEGPGVARGYANQPSQTAASFISPPPWAPKRAKTIADGRRFYRTGNMARYYPDGNLVFVGRQDNQVKIRSQRFELGDVETTIASCAAIRNVVAAVHNFSLDQKRLVAVVSLVDKRLPCAQILQLMTGSDRDRAVQDISNIYQSLQAKLPSYMLPSTWCVVERLPSTTTSKLDRKRVRQWLQENEHELKALAIDMDHILASSEPLTPPKTDVEKLLQSVWSSVLGKPEELIGRESSFLQLGGDSILAMRVANRCLKHGYELMTRTLLRNVSLAVAAATHMAPLLNAPVEDKLNDDVEMIEHDLEISPFAGTTSLMTAFGAASMGDVLRELNLDESQVDSAYPCLPIQDGILMSQLKGSGYEYLNRIAFQITHKSEQQTLDVQEQVIQAWQAICDCQPILRTVFTTRVASGGGFYQIVLRHVDVKGHNVLIGEDTILQHGNIVESLRTHARPTFQPGRVPYRLTLFRSSNRSLYVLLDISHAIIDAQTLDILRSDLYRACCNSSPLSRRQNLASYVAWTQKHQQSSQEYWRSRLSGVQPCIVVSESVGRCTDQELLEPQRQMDIPFTASDQLTDFCKQKGYTISSIMQFAWAVVLKLVTGAESPCFGFTASGRDIVDGAEQTMGPLLSLLVGRVMLAPNDAVDVLLQMTGENTAEAMAHPACSLADVYRFLGLGTAVLFNTLVSIVHFWDNKKLATQSDIEIEELLYQDPNEYSLGLKVGYSKDKFRTWIEYQPTSISDPLASHVARTLAAVLKSILTTGADQNLNQLIKNSNNQMESPTPYSLLQKLHTQPIKKLAALQCEIPKSHIEDILPCTAEQLRHMSHSTGRRVNVGWRRLVLTASADVQLSQFCKAFEAVEVLLTALRTRIVSSDEFGIYQVIHRPGALWMEEDNLKEYRESVTEILVRYGGPLCQFARIEPNEGPGYAILSMHPAVCDEKTFHLVATCIENAYRDSKIILPSSFCTFVDYSMHRRTRNVKKQRQELEDAAIWPFIVTSAHGSGQLESTSLDMKFSYDQTKAKPENILQAAWALCLAYRTGSSKVGFSFDTDEADHFMIPNADLLSGPTLVRRICTVDLSQTDLSCGGLLTLISEAMNDAASAATSTVESDSHAISYVRDQFLGTRLDIKAKAGSDQFWNKFESSLIPSVEFIDSPVVIQCHVKDDSAMLVAITRGVPSYQTATLLKQYEHFILQMTSQDSDTLLCDIDPVCSSEVGQVRGWNQHMPLAVEACVHEQFRTVVEQHPSHPAVCAWDHEEISYTQLDRLSNAMARLLVDKGIRAETIVPFLCEKSALAPVMMMGILKTGGAMLALDATHPTDRLASIVQDCAAPLILTSPSKYSVAENLPAQSLSVNFKTLFEGDERPLEHRSHCVAPSNACYVVYTSGSTGTPKGIVVSHRNAATFFRDFQHRFGITSETRALQVLNFIFDASIGSMLCALMHGATVCMPSEQQLTDDMGATFRHFRANFVNMTPTQSFLLRPEDVTGTLHTLALGGEPLPTKLIQIWSSRVRLINVYGPSETTVWSSSRDVTADGESADPRNIGHPAGCRYWVVQPDNHDQLVPIGCPGELLIEGPLVARGYLNDPQKTGTVFLERPPLWAKEFPGLDFEERFYKSGDLVTQHPLDGSILYLDRKDTQVKVRGQRIELGEIEHHLARLVDDARWRLIVELVQPNGQDHTRAYLAVFYVMPAKALAEVEEYSSSNAPFFLPMSTEVVGLREKALAIMPEYMVPNIYYHIRQVPLTGSGKTDRKFLRRMAQSLTAEEVATHYVTSPDSGLRQTIASNKEQGIPQIKGADMSEDGTHLHAILESLWLSVLPIGAASISDKDSFFRLGGNSAAAIQLVAAARDRGYSISVAQIFQNERLHDQARLLSPVAIRDDLNLVIRPFSLFGKSVQADELRHRAASMCEVEEAHIEDVFPCTPLQEGLVAMSYKRPGDYVAQIAIELTDAIDVDLLARAWQNTIDQMPILRTCIVDLGKEGLAQVILKPEASLSISQHISIDDALSEVTFQHGAILGLILNQISLVQGLGFQDSPCLFWAAHHAVYDGWILARIFQTLERAYYALKPPLWTPFQHFVRHSLEVTQSEVTKKFWRDHFSEMLAEPFPPLLSPTYSPRANSTLEYKIDNFKNPKGGFTRATAIRAAWAILQASYSNASEVLLGAVVSGRQANVVGIERLAGPTIATVPLRLRVDPKSSTDQFLTLVQQQALDVIEHEQIGLQNLQRLSPEAAEACRFQTLLLVQPEKPRELDTSEFYRGLRSQTASDADAFKSFSQYALLLVCQQEESALNLQFIFDSNVIHHDLVSRMSRQLESVLGTICLGGLQPVSDMMHAGSQDLNDIWQWNDMVPLPVESSMHDLIGQTMTKYPSAPAVAAWDGALTYHELDLLSHRLALYLNGIGVGRGTIIPLCFEKSMWMPVATMAVMRAGGTCITMDVSLPRERLLAISAQVASTAILASLLQHDLASDIADGAPVVVVNQDFFDRLPKPLTDQQQLPIVTASDQLYICFTSGSTGVPKGVIVMHGNFSSAVKHQAAAIGLTPNSRVFDFASYSVDMSWYNLLHTLYAGACLCVPGDDERTHDISGAILRLGANWICATPTVAGIIDDQALEYLQDIELFGELGNANLLVRLRSNGKRHVRSAYGPTETTGLVTGITGADSHANIGHGVGAVTWIVGGGYDTPIYLVPIGGVGELWIEGPLVALGYLQDAEKTAAAFVEDPPWLLAGSMGHTGRRGRLYRTGDLVRYNQDGTIIFLGRNDDQVKIRGQRVELMEVEHHLREALAGTRSTTPDNQLYEVIVEVITPQNTDRKVLAAFIVPPGADAMSDSALSEIVDKLAAEIHSPLREILPRYMLPDAYVPLRNMPPASNSKRDRRKLQRLGAAYKMKELRSKKVIGPTNATEAALRQIWSDILRCPVHDISIEGDFSELGGDSISAMRIASRCRQLELRISMDDLLRCATIKKVATTIDSSMSSSPVKVNSDAKPPRASNGDDVCGIPFELSPIQQFYFEAEHSEEITCVMCQLLSLPKTTSYQSVENALNELISRHDMLRARFTRNSMSGKWSQYISNSITDSLLIQYNDETVNESNMLICIDSLNIENGPLVSAMISRRDNLLFLAVHHLVADMASIQILLNEFAMIMAGESLPPIPPGFQQWIVSEIDYARACLHPSTALPSPSLQPLQLSYWNITDKSIRFLRYKESHLILDPTLSKAILGQCNRVLQTHPVDLITAALMHSFHLVFPDRNVPPCFNIGLGREACRPYDNSQYQDMSNTIGWFATMSPVQMSASSCTRIGTAIDQAKARATRTLPNRGAAYFLSRYYHPEGQQVLDASTTNEHDHRANIYEVQLNYQVGFSPHYDKNDTTTPSSISTLFSEATGSSPMISTNNKRNETQTIQQLPLPSALKRIMATRFIPWTVFSITVPPLAKSEDGQARLKFVFEYVTASDVALQWIDCFERSLREIVDLSAKKEPLGNADREELF